MCFNHHTRALAVLAALWASAQLVSAQSPAGGKTSGVVSNVDANQEGKSIAITYDLRTSANVSVFYTQDGGKTRTQIPRAFLSGDVGIKIAPGNNKRILWRVLEQYPDQGFHADNMSFIVQGQVPLAFFAQFNAGYALDSGVNVGLTIGQLGRMGWYAKFMSTLSLPQSTDFESDEKGYVDGVLPVYTGTANTFKMYGVAGVLFQLASPLYLNAGLGYGTRVANWEISDGRWVKNVPLSYGGLAIDAGLMVRLDKVALSAGVTLVKGNADIFLGVGYVF